MIEADAAAPGQAKLWRWPSRQVAPFEVFLLPGSFYFAEVMIIPVPLPNANAASAILLAVPDGSRGPPDRRTARRDDRQPRLPKA